MEKIKKIETLKYLFAILDGTICTSEDLPQNLQSFIPFETMQKNIVTGKKLKEIARQTLAEILVNNNLN